MYLYEYLINRIMLAYTNQLRDKNIKVGSFVNYIWYDILMEKTDNELMEEYNKHKQYIYIRG